MGCSEPGEFGQVADREAVAEGASEANHRPIERAFVRGADELSSRRQRHRISNAKRIAGL